MFVLLFVVAGLLAGLQWWHVKHSLRGVHYDFTISRVLLAPGESFELVTALTNTAYLFIPYLCVLETVPEGIEVGDGFAPDRNDFGGEPRMLAKIYLRARSTWTRHIPAALPQRGRYAFRRTWLWGGDFLGTSEKMRSINRTAEVVVYPAPAADLGIRKRINGFLGDMSVRRFIFDDPIQTVGFREYTGREPFKSISWLQSARQGFPMVKVQDYTADITISVLLDVTPPDGAAAISEHTLSLAHTVCRHLESAKITYDFYTNFATLGARYTHWRYIPEGLGTAHFQKILEGLGRATIPCVETTETLVARVAKQSRATGLIVITPAQPRMEGLLRKYGLGSPLVIHANAG